MKAERWSRRKRAHFRGLGAAVLVLSAAAGFAAHAANNGAPDPDILLGPVRAHASETEAHAACPKDAIVWADRRTGIFYNPSEPQYATTPAGAFVCRRDAIHGRYWDTDPYSHMEGRPGRSFPYQPLYPGS